MKFLNSIIVIILLLTACGTAQRTGQQDIPGGVKAMLDSRQFVFRANSAHPLGGGQIILDNQFDVIMRNDSLICHLPYYGRAFSAPMGGDGGIKFISTQFDYSVTPGKKGAYTAAIRINENIDVSNMSFSISESGYGSLIVTSKNRQSISFNGTMAPIKR